MSSIEIIYPGEAVALNPESPGFAHGFGLFETICLREKRIELWEAHWQRLTGSARELGVDCRFENCEVLEAVKTLARKLPADATIKLSLLREGDSSKMLVYSRASYFPPAAIGLLGEDAFRINEASPLAGHKTHNYLENLLALESARGRGCYETLRLNSKGQVAEGAISNIFFVRDGSLHTPCAQTGLLPGVVRSEIMQSLAVEEGSYALSDLFSADAVFLTNASIGFCPVDWLLSSGEKIQLASRQNEWCEQVRQLLADRVKATAVRI